MSWLAKNDSAQVNRIIDTFEKYGITNTIPADNIQLHYLINVVIFQKKREFTQLDKFIDKYKIKYNTTTNFPAGRETIMSQFRVWPFPSTIITTFGKRNRNPGHHFAGVRPIISLFYLNYVGKNH